LKNKNNALKDSTKPFCNTWSRKSV